MTVITSQRLSLRKWEFNAPRLKTMVRWLKDPDVVRYSEQRHRQHDEESQLDYVTNFPGIFREIYVQHVAEDDFIGTISAHLDLPNSVADVGILIGDKSAWGKGYGYEAWSTFCNHLLTHGIRKIEAGCMTVNTPMMRICKHYGMFREGRREEHFLWEKQMIVGLAMWGKFGRKLT